jgi:CBS domain-containing protein
MLARDIMTKHVELGNPDMTLKEAAVKMKSGDFGMLPIGENDRLIGSITDRDIVIRGVAEGKDVNSITVRDVMSKGIHYCFEDQDCDEIAKNFSNHQIRRLPVLNRDRRLVGILSLGDLSHSDVNPSKVEETLAKISQSKGAAAEGRLH